MSAQRKSAVESYEPGNDCNFTWKIHEVSLFNATGQHPARSSHFSTLKGEVWQLGMYKQYLYSQGYYICVNMILRSANTSSTNVHVDLSIVAQGRKHLIKQVRCRLIKGHEVELWKVKTQDVLDLLKQHGVKDDVLTLDINIEVWQGNTVEINCPEHKPLQNLNSQMTKMLSNQTLTDVTLNVQNKEFKAHKVVLAAASPVFEAMFKEGTKEHRDNYVVIRDIKKDVFEVFLRYLYTGQVDKLDEKCLDLLATADKYDVQPLKEICAQHMAKNISVDNAVDILALAHRHSIDSVKTVASVYLKDNFFDVTQTDSWASLFDNYVAKK